MHRTVFQLCSYDLSVAICSLIQSKGGRPIEQMTAETKNDKPEMVLQLRQGIIWQI